jgi:hypothetical protein
VKAWFSRKPRKLGWPKGQKRFGWGGKKRPPPEDLDVPRFLQEHARALAHLVRRCPDEDQQKRLAYGYRDLLAGGPHQRWIALLRQLGIG